MNKTILKYAVSYPLLEHPLQKEKIELKINYIKILEYYAHKFCKDDDAVVMRIERFKQDFISQVFINEQNKYDRYKGRSNELEKIFFVFKLFFYRYILLFDSIFLLSPLDDKIAKKICYELKNMIPKQFHKDMDIFVQQMFSDNPIYSDKYMITKEMFQAWIDTKKFLKTKDNIVLFTATMSSGKSTLINALIGQDLSYTKKAACTSTAIEFCSTPVYHTNYNVFEKEKNYVNLLPSKVRDFTKVSEHTCIVQGYFESQIQNRKITLIDTPGINSSQNSIHKKITREVLLNKKIDILVYVIPVEYYGSEDDYFHLQFVNQKVEYKKILFVVNMMDTCYFEDDSVEEILDDISEHLKEIGFIKPIVCPISAKAGLLFKQALAGNSFSKKQENELKIFASKFSEPELDLSKFYHTIKISIFHRNKYQIKNISYQEMERLYFRTGLPGLEMLLLKNIEEE